MIRRPPRSTLDGSSAASDVYKRQEKGWLILENHFDQSEKVKQLLIKNKFTSIEIVKDLSGIGRFTIGRYK